MKPLSCTFTSYDTCFISRQMYPHIPQNITCDPRYNHCDIQISGENIVLWSNWLYILCPTGLCEECTIKCEDDYSCSFMKIYGYNCAILYVEIRSSKQMRMEIYAPANGGTLIYKIRDAFSSNYLYNISIYSNPGTYDIIIYASKC
eukprot:276639_1